MAFTALFRVGRPARRLTGAFFALLLLASTVEAAWAVGHCPHHDALPAEAVPQPARESAHHGAHGGAHAAPAAEPEQSDAHGCTCVGSCATVDANVAPPRTPVTVVPVESVRLRAEAPDVRIAAREILDLLPWSIAPPQA